jgi:hypothetical protein
MKGCRQACSFAEVLIGVVQLFTAVSGYRAQCPLRIVDHGIRPRWLFAGLLRGPSSHRR